MAAPAPDGWLAPPAPPLSLAVDETPFEAWRRAFEDKAVAAGWPRERVAQALSGLTLDATVVAADRRQPELSRTVGSAAFCMRSR